MRTISRSKRTVVVRVSWPNAAMEYIRATLATAGNNHRDTVTQRDRVLCASVSLWLLPVVSRVHIEGKCECVNFIVSPELRPGAVETGFRHQAFECHIGAAAQFFEIRAWRNQELGRPAVVIRL